MIFGFFFVVFPFFSIAVSYGSFDSLSDSEKTEKTEPLNPCNFLLSLFALTPLSVSLLMISLSLGRRDIAAWLDTGLYMHHSIEPIVTLE